ncbi:MAG TPA: outer membrane beta-barrel protein [Opitutaceae bacterium]|nr:outer membrane beta-barrel protein [Opitutaceae bacterium]
MNPRLTLALSAAVIAAGVAHAQVKVNDSLTLTGWAVGSYQYTQPQNLPSFDSLNLDAALLSAVVTPTKGLTATISTYYRPSAEGGVSPGGSEATILDAYLSYDAGGGLTLSAGKFLSYLGYESFYFNLDNMISLANQQLLAPIPGYHDGVKFDFAVDKTLTVGAALVDALYQKPGYAATAADGELKHNAGFEAYLSYTGVPNLTVWAGVGYQTKTKPGFDTSGIVDPHGSEVTVADVWASYTIDKSSTLALEEIYKDGGTGNKGSNWLAYYQYKFSDKAYSWFCVSGENVSEGGPRYVKYSVAPTFVVNSNLSVRAQYSYTDYKNYWVGGTSVPSANFVGAEVILSF